MPTGTETELSEKGKAALTYIGMGLAVFPLGKGSKKPSIQGGSTQWTKGDEDVIEWWEKHPDDNVAIVAGAPSDNLVIIDVDVDEDTGEDGFETINMWQKSHGEWPDTACVTTPSGGEHFYYRIPENVHNSADKNLGVDVRGIGGYAVAPPSVYRRDDGTEGRYEWDLDVEDYGISQANQSVLDFIASLAKSTADTGERFKLPREIREGERNDTLFRYACQMRAQSVPEPSIADFLMVTNMQRCKPPLNEGDVRDIARHVIERYPEGKSEKFTEEDERKAKTEFVKDRLRGPDGKIRNTVKNAMTVLQVDPRFAGRFRYDEMAYRKTVDLPLPWDHRAGTRPIVDSDYSQFFSTVETEFGLSTKEKTMDAIVNVCMLNQYNPVQEWLRSLEWDGEDHISTIAEEYLGIPRSEYVTACIDLWLRGAVARALHPGCKFDYMLVIHGEQGVGKSYFLSLFSPDQSWYDGNLNTLKDKDVKERLRGKWILNFDELEAWKKSQDIQALKSFVTNPCDTFRPAYGRETEDRPRVCVFAGTTNDDSFLVDPSGNRRFLVLDVPLAPNEPTPKMLAALSRRDAASHDFSQCMAQAFHEYEHGATDLRLPRDIEREAEEERSRFEEEDARVSEIQKYMETRLRTWKEAGMPAPAPRVCMKQLARDALDMKDWRSLSQRDAREIRTIGNRYVADWVEWPSKSGKARVDGWGVVRCFVPEVAVNEGLLDASATPGKHVWKQENMQVDE